MHRSRGFIDFRADQRRPPGPGRNDVFSRQSESPVKHDVPSNLSEAVQRAVRMRDRIENRYERARSQVRPRSRERIRSRSRAMRSRSRSRARSVRARSKSLRARSKSGGRTRCHSRDRSMSRSSSRPRSRTSSRRRSRSPSRQRSRSRGRSRRTSPRGFRSRSRGQTNLVLRSPRVQSPGRCRRSASRGRSPSRFRRNGRVSRFEPPDERNRSHSRSRVLQENSPFTSLTFTSGALSRFEAPPSPKIDTLSPDLTEDHQCTEDLYDGVANDSVQSLAPSNSFLNPTFRPMHSPRKDLPRSPKLQSPVNSIYPDVPAEVPQGLMTENVSGSSPNRSMAPEERYREILALREGLRLAEERHEIETRQETFPRSYVGEPTARGREIVDRRINSKHVDDRLGLRDESLLHRAPRGQPDREYRPQVTELYERLSPMERSRQAEHSAPALQRNDDDEPRYGRVSPRRTESQDAFSRSSDGPDAELKLMQQSIEELRRQIREKEIAARHVRSVGGYTERSGSRNEDNSVASVRPPSSFQEMERRDFRLGSKSPEHHHYSRIHDAPLNRELFSRRSRSPYSRRTPSPYERRTSPWPIATSPPAPCQIAPATNTLAADDAMLTGHYGSPMQTIYHHQAYVNTPNEVHTIPNRVLSSRNAEFNANAQAVHFTALENAPTESANHYSTLFQYTTQSDVQNYSHCAPFDYQQRAGSSTQPVSLNIPVMQGRDRPNLKTLTGSNPPPQGPETAGPAVLNNGLKKKRRKKKFDSAGEGPTAGTAEIGSDMDIEEEETASSKDLSRKPEEKYADEIRSYLRLTQKKDSEKERLVALKSEMSRISKLQADLLCLRKKFPDDPMLGRQLSNAAKLYEEAKKRAQGVHSQSEALNQDIFKIPQKIKLLAMEHEALFRDRVPPVVSGNKSKTSPTTKHVVYKYVDRGDHFCSFCKQEFRSISSVLSHLHSSVHLLNSKQTTERPWASTESQTKVSSQLSMATAPSKVPAKGAQFLLGVNGFYCRLCKSMFPDTQTAEDHIVSEAHNQKYKDYICLNPFYERRVQLEKETLVHSVAVAAAPRQVSQIRSPSQPPGVESDLEKVTSSKHDHESIEKPSKLDECSTNKDGAQLSVQVTNRPQTQVISGRKLKTTLVDATGSRMVLPAFDAPHTKSVNPSQKSGGIRLKLLKSTASGQPLIVGKAPFKRKPSQDTKETTPIPYTVTTISAVKAADETPFIPSDEELEEY